MSAVLERADTRGALSAVSSKEVQHGRNTVEQVPHRTPWNKGKLVGQKAPFKPKDIWALRLKLQREYLRELALLNLGVDSKLRACDLVALRVLDITHGDRVAPRAIVQQNKTGRPVQFEITAPAREAAGALIKEAQLKGGDFLFPSRIHSSPHICVRQYARMLRGWLKDIGLDWTAYGTHSMRRTKATLLTGRFLFRQTVSLSSDAGRSGRKGAVSRPIRP